MAHYLAKCIFKWTTVGGDHSQRFPSGNGLLLAAPKRHAVHRENKNRFVMAFLAWLVGTKVFDIIEMAFLPVGHTHEVMIMLPSHRRLPACLLRDTEKLCAGY